MNSTSGQQPTAPEYGIVIVSEHYRWHEWTDQFEDIRTGDRLKVADYDAKLKVFEDRVRSWFLDVASKHVESNSTAGHYVALFVAIAYIEAIEQYRRGESTPKNESGQWFKSSACRLFSGPSRAVSPAAVDRL